MYVVASDSRQISLVSGCFYCSDWLPKKEAGLPVRVETNFPDRTIYLLASGRRSAAKVTHLVLCSQYWVTMVYFFPNA